MPTIYQHYKGKQYQLLHIAVHSETQEKFVVYQALYGDFSIWIRPMEMFFANVMIEDKEVPRFKQIINKGQ